MADPRMRHKYPAEQEMTEGNFLSAQIVSGHESPPQKKRHASGVPFVLNPCINVINLSIDTFDVRCRTFNLQ